MSFENSSGSESPIHGAVQDPKLREYLIAKGIGDLLQKARPDPSAIAAAKEEAVYLATKGIPPQQ